MNAYLAAMKQASLEGLYIPEVFIVFLREDNFQIPRALALGPFH